MDNDIISPYKKRKTSFLDLEKFKRKFSKQGESSSQLSPKTSPTSSQ